MQKGAHIPDELVVDILKSLPAKSRLRFKCVCKSWLSFISQLRYDNEEFILPTLYCFRSFDFKASGEVKLVKLGLPLSNLVRFTVIGSCNGLLCVENCEDGLCIWNPWTKRHKKVSSSKINVSTKVTYLSGFGYDHSIDDYIIVRCIRSYKLGRVIVEIYSRKTDSWFQMGKLPQQIIMSYLPIVAGLFVNGTLYWHVEYVDDKYNGLLQTILCFDLVDRKFSMIVLPDDREKKPDFDLGVLGGQLCMINYDHDCHSDIWAWEGNINKGSNWIKLMSIPSDSIYLGPKSVAPVFLMKNGDVVLRIIKAYYVLSPYAGRRKRKRRYVIEYLENFFIYNQKHKTLRELTIPYNYCCWHYDKEITYTRSLVSPASDAGDDQKSSFCYNHKSITSLCLCRSPSEMDIPVQEMKVELQQHSTTTTREYEREVKLVICEHLLSEFGPHCKSSTSQVSLQWTIELDPM